MNANAGTRLVPEMIAMRAAANPHLVAVQTETGTLTYGQLVDRATRVARALRRAGAGRDRIVGLAGPRDADGVVAMVGIMISGAAYVYLDPGLPVERLRYIVAQTHMRLVVGAAAAAIAELGPTAVNVAVDPAIDALHDIDDDGPPVPVRRTDLCYVVYTSGSTGVPKGVAVEHGGVANMARQLARTFLVEPDSRMLQFAAWSWDAAVCEILVTLTAGAAVVLTPDSIRDGGEALAAFLRRQRVTVATLTPSLLAALPDDGLPDLETVVAVGEACPASVVDRWAPGRRMFNGYGPTEATVAVSIGRCRRGEPVTIGRPVPGVDVRVVDGELLVGGVGVARGYLGDGPALVVEPGEAFITDPDGTRWYRTGDIVDQDQDGTLSYVGRVDEQVQLHGHRIELGEVAAAIRRHPQVAAAAVVVTGGRLVAYVLPDDGSVQAAQVRAEAAAWLPAHQVPDVRIVERLPLTANGKLDRAALIADETLVIQSASGGGVDLMGRVLDRVRFLLESSDIGPHDDFFDMGGHSLLAAQLAIDLSGRFGAPITAAQVSYHRTAARLAELIDRPAGIGEGLAELVDGPAASTRPDPRPVPDLRLIPDSRSFADARPVPSEHDATLAGTCP